VCMIDKIISIKYTDYCKISEFNYHIFFSNALNMCLENLNNDAVPILALCDGQDVKQTRLLGTIVSENWFTTLEAVSTGMTTMAARRDDCRRILQKHLEQSHAQEHDVRNIQYQI